MSYITVENNGQDKKIKKIIIPIARELPFEFLSARIFTYSLAIKGVIVITIPLKIQHSLASGISFSPFKCTIDTSIKLL